MLNCNSSLCSQLFRAFEIQRIKLAIINALLSDVMSRDPVRNNKLTITVVLNAMSVAMVTTGTARRNDSARRYARIAYVRAFRSWAGSCPQSSTTRKATKRYWSCTDVLVHPQRPRHLRLHPELLHW